MINSAGRAARDVVRFALGQVWSYLRAQGVLSVGEETDPDLLPDAEGDAHPGKRTPPSTGLPKRQPKLGAGRIEHPLPDLSEQDAARMARMLADERAKLEKQPASGTPDDAAESGQHPATVPHAFLPEQRRAELRSGCLVAVPPRNLAAEPAWHALGTMVGQRPGEEAGVLRLTSLAEDPPSVPAVEADAEADAGPGTSTDPAIAAVQETFAIVGAAGDDAAAYFYGWLFAANPELRALFPIAMNEQRDRLFRALGRIVGSLSTPEELAAYLAQLGRDHRKYAVEREMYDAVGEALMAALRAFAGPAFTPAAEEAWAQAYKTASSLMAAAADEDSLTSPPFWAGEVVGNEQRRPGISILTVATYLPLPYEPGQHVTVQTPRWPKVWRPYSVACRPREDGLLTFHIKAVPGGWVSNALVYSAEPGSELSVGPALGTMTLRRAEGRDLLCVAGGTGLAPIKAIIEQAIRESADRPRNIHLFYGARTREDLYDLPELWHLADAYPGFYLTPVTSDDPAFDGMQGSVGRVAARYMPHRECEAYVAGPRAMVLETVAVLAKSGLPRERVHYDEALLADGEQPGTDEQAG
jgi:NAD(P)H-flavin reductase/hemoglobin-like flavoprotein